MNVVAFGHNRLDFIAQRIQQGHERAIKGGQEWVEGTLEVAQALAEAREATPADIAFSDWLKHSKLDFYSKNDRAALIGFASDIALARTILTETTSRSYREIWQKNKNRFPGIGKPARAASMRYTKPRNHRPGRADMLRRMKLGDETIDKLKGTSLGSAAELDELVILNRGAAEGEHTAIVARLIADATAGKDVSAIAETEKMIGTKRKLPTLIEAWRKRMISAWELASKKEQEQLIDYLMNHLKH